MLRQPEPWACSHRAARKEETFLHLPLPGKRLSCTAPLPPSLPTLLFCWGPPALLPTHLQGRLFSLNCKRDRLLLAKGTARGRLSSSSYSQQHEVTATGGVIAVLPAFSLHKRAQSTATCKDRARGGSYQLGRRQPRPQLAPPAT